MGAIRKRIRRDGTPGWQAQVRLSEHEPLVRTFDRKSDALGWVREVEQKIKTGGTIDMEAARTTLGDALDRYAREVTPLKKGKRAELVRIKVWKRHKLAHRSLPRLRGSDFAEYRDQRRAEGAAEGTIRLDLALISHLFTVAIKDWGMESLKNPVRHMTLPGSSEERKRRLKAGEEARLMAALAQEGPLHAPLAAFAIETGARQGELLSLTWRAVDLPASTMHFPDTKADEPRTVPLSPRAIELLKALPRAIDDSAPVFPMTADEVQRAFRRACNAAGISDLRFHDLRREAISRLFERGLSLPQVAAISGHSTWSQLRRYTVVKPEDLVKELSKGETA